MLDKAHSKNSFGCVEISSGKTLRYVGHSSIRVFREVDEAGALHVQLEIVSSFSAGKIRNSFSRPLIPANRGTCAMYLMRGEFKQVFLWLPERLQ